VTALLALAAALAASGCGPRRIAPDMKLLRDELPERFDDRDWAFVLRENVRDDLVDYEHLAEHRAPLERFLAYVSVVGPFTTPNQFRTDQERTAFWINCYNALALRFVLEQYPTDTVYPLVGPNIEYDFSFPVDGQPMTLHDIEVRALRDSHDDMRLLFCLCAAAKGCPPLEAQPFRGEDLPRRLHVAAEQAMANPNIVRRDDENQRLLVWYPLLTRETAFIRYYERSKATSGAGLITVLLDFAAPEQRRMLNAAIDYELGAIPFDHSLNRWEPPQKPNDSTAE
jgi:hypothetical protein